MLTDKEALDSLSCLKDSGSDRSILELGWIDQLIVRSPKGIVRLNLPSYAQAQRDRIAKEIKDAKQYQKENNNFYEKIDAR